MRLGSSFESTYPAYAFAPLVDAVLMIARFLAGASAPAWSSAAGAEDQAPAVKARRAA